MQNAADQQCYDGDFHRVTADMNKASACAVVHELARLLPISSVADFGCGQGMWLSTWQQGGVAEIVGIDGPHVDPATLEISADGFRCMDLSEPIDLGRRFDLVQSLEVAEHLPRASAEDFVDSLIRHSDLVLFSAAPPGQGGVGHINEQPYSWWARRFVARGYTLFDAIRPALVGRPELQPWYRYNTFLFVSAAAESALPEEVARTRVEPGSAIPEFAPASYRLRKLIVRCLPARVQEACADLAMRWRARNSATATAAELA